MEKRGLSVSVSFSFWSFYFFILWTPVSHHRKCGLLRHLLSLWAESSKSKANLASYQLSNHVLITHKGHSLFILRVFCLSFPDSSGLWRSVGEECNEKPNVSCPLSVDKIARWWNGFLFIEKTETLKIPLRWRWTDRQTEAREWEKEKMVPGDYYQYYAI